MDLHLLIHNIASIFSAVIIFGMAVFTYLNDSRSPANRAFSLMLICAAVFSVSHVIGVNVSDPQLSRNVLMFNLCMFPTGAFLLHSVLAMLGKNIKYRLLIYSAYIVSVAFVAFFIFNPDLFLLGSVPKMYFPNYYQPGLLNWTRLVFLDVVIFPTALILLLQAYKKASVQVMRNRYAYFIVALICGFCVVYIPNFLVDDVEIDPLIGMFFAVVCVIPFAYAAVRYELFNVKVIAKQAFAYSIGVALIGGGLTLMNYVGIWLSSHYPAFPVWSITFMSAIIVVTISFVIWRQLRENDELKYGFITTVTHKFRTPLTQIKWASESLISRKLDDEGKDNVRQIQIASQQLVELINVLAITSKTEDVDYGSNLSDTNLSQLINDVIIANSSRSAEKHAAVKSFVKPGVHAMCDSSRIRFVLQTLIDNALSYTPVNAEITISLSYSDNVANVSVSDTGIGIEHHELSKVFSKFYRSDSAMKSDTEGLGMALFIANKIIVAHGGSISVESEGIGRGSKFYFKLPKASIVN